MSSFPVCCADAGLEMASARTAAAAYVRFMMFLLCLAAASALYDFCVEPYRKDCNFSRSRTSRQIGQPVVARSPD
jgi:hypothetical protein